MSALAEQTPRRIEDALLLRAQEGTDNARIALVDGERTLTYATLAERARRFADALAAAGVEPGDRVAVFLDKTAEAVVAVYATWMAGAVMVPVGESLKARQLDHIVRHSGSRVLVTARQKLLRLDPLPVVDATVVLAEADDSREDSHEPMSAPASATRADLPGDDSPAAILYTSGSTGLPKGIVVSHANLRAGAEIVSEYLGIRPDDRILSVLPFGFDYGLNQLLTAVERGATLVLHRSHLPADICRALETHRITGLAGVPPLWIQLWQGRSPLPAMTLPHLRYITNTGGVFPPELVAKYRAAFPGVRIFLMYGLSEAFRSTFLPPEEIDRRPGSIGRAIPRTEILVLDESGHECPPGVAGELVHRGPTVALGYHDDPEATARAFRPDPFSSAPDAPRVVYSGDLVRRDDEGFLHFVGRRDQLIKCLGHRMSPDEIEVIVQGSGLVAEVVAKGVSDPLAGQVVELHIIPRDDVAFSQAALVGYCRREMPSYMLPKAIHLHTSFPRTASGKVDRRQVGQAA